MLLTATVVTTTPAPPAEASAPVPANCDADNPEDCGTEDHPYLIATRENLMWLRDQTNDPDNARVESGVNVNWSSGKHFLQTADIDLASIPNWEPIGLLTTGSLSRSTSNGFGFQGTYHGGNFAIRNLQIDSSGSMYRGLFGYVWGATLKNIRIEGATVASGASSGILLGASNCFSCTSPTTDISRVSVTGSITANGDRVGGIVGNPARETFITGQNVFVGDVTGTGDVGGIVGRASGNSALSFSYARANVTGTNVGSSAGVGILIGNASTGAGTFQEMYAQGTVAVNAGTPNKGVIGIAPNPTSPSSSANHVVTDVWYDNAGGLTLIGNANPPESHRVTIAGGGGLTTAQMLGAEASDNMLGTDGRWDFSSDGAWRTVPGNYPAFEWQAGDEVTVSGTVSLPAGLSPIGVTVTARSTDELLDDVTFDVIEESGAFSLTFLSGAVRSITATTEDADGLTLSDGIERPSAAGFVNESVINLALAARSIRIGSGATSGAALEGTLEGTRFIPFSDGAMLSVTELSDTLLTGDVTVVAGADVIVDADLAPALTAARTLTLRAGGKVTFEPGASLSSSGEPLDVVLETDTLEAATDASIASSGGSLRVAPRTASRPIVLGGPTPATSGTLGVPTSLVDASLSSLMLGDEDTTGPITLGAFATTALSLRTTGTVTQTGALTGGSGLDVVGASSVILTDASNAIGSLAADPVGTLRVVNGGALTLGPVDATGPVDVRTSAGDLTLDGTIATSAPVGADGTGPALLLAAATSAPVGDTAAGDVTLGTGASLDLATGARALLSTGTFDADLTALPATAVFDVAFADAATVADGVTVAFRDAAETAVGTVAVPTPGITTVTPLVGALELAFTADGAGDADSIEWSVDGGPWVRRTEASTASPVVVPTPGAVTQRAVRLRFVLGGIPGEPSEPATGTPTAPPAPPAVPVAPPLPTAPVATPGGTPPAPSAAPTARLGEAEAPIASTPAGTVREEGATTVSTATILEVGRAALALDVTGAGDVRTAAGGAPQVRVARDTVARTSGSGMLPDTSVAVWLPRDGSDVRRITTLDVAADGTFTGSLPFDGSGDRATDGRPLPIGRQVLQLVGVDADGQLLVVEQTVTITQPAPSPEPDRAAGAPPALTPGASIATNAGLPEAVTVTPLPDVRQARVEGTGWTMAVDVPSADGRVAPTDDGGALIELVADDVASVSGDGFLPGTRADVWLFSTPTLIGSVTIGGDGTFTGEVTIDGERIAIGEHTLQLQGVGRDGYVRAANLGVVVVPADATPPDEAPAPEPDTTEPPDAPAVDAPDGPDGSVEVVIASDTTSGTTRIVLLILAAVALLAGGWWLANARRGRGGSTATT